jgi:hypothetical protein
MNDIIKAARDLIARLDRLSGDVLFAAMYRDNFRAEAEKLREALDWSEQKLPPIGSKWADTDKRMTGRVVEVIGYDKSSGKVLVFDGATRTRVSPARFGKNSNGFRATA